MLFKVILKREVTHKLKRHHHAAAHTIEDVQKIYQRKLKGMPGWRVDAIVPMDAGENKNE